MLLAHLPPLSLLNATTIIYRYPNLELKLADLKTLNENLSRGDLNIIRHFHPDIKRGDITVGLIMAFCLSFETEEASVVPHELATVMSASYKQSTHERTFKAVSELMTPSCKKIILPIQLSTLSWVLGTALIQGKQLLISGLCEINITCGNVCLKF